MRSSASSQVATRNVAALADQRRREPLAVARELVREAALEAGVALVGGAVERRA